MRMLRSGLVLLSCLFVAACASVLGIRPQSNEHPFEHKKHLNAGVACVTCHANVSFAADDAPVWHPDTKTCTSCHSKPHDSRPCNGCHGERHTREEAVMARDHLRFAHAQHLPKLGGQCVPCHSAAGQVDATSMRPSMAQCLGCHAHKDQWKTRECDACHRDLPTELAKPTSHVVHEGDFIREHGIRATSSRDLCATCHGEGFCASCHGLTTAALPWRFSFDRPALSGLHRAGFAQRHADEARANPGLCGTCHTSEQYCLDCHTRKRAASSGGTMAAARSPHPAGWIRARGGEHGRAARLDPVSCASCHGGDGEALCVGCHRVGGPGGNPHGRGFASALDPKRDRPCRMCHGGG